MDAIVQCHRSRRKSMKFIILHLVCFSNLWGQQVISIPKIVRGKEIGCRAYVVHERTEDSFHALAEA